MLIYASCRHYQSYRKMNGKQMEAHGKCEVSTGEVNLDDLVTLKRAGLKLGTLALKKSFCIETTWDGECLCHDPVKISLSQSPNGDLLMKVDAPFFNTPAKPDGPAGQPFPQLWDYEVVEAFFLNDQDQYLEVELSPHGQHLLLLLNGRRKMVKDKLPLSFTATIKGDNWTGEAVIPRDYLPPSVTKFNAYAIHGEGDDRQYEALYPVTDKAEGQQPDFHRLELFRPLDMSAILNNYDATTVSSLWTSVLNP